MMTDLPSHDELSEALGIRLVRFVPEHIDMMDVQQIQKDGMQDHKQELSHGDAWTVVRDGHPIACGGLVEVWEGRAYAWAIVGADAGPSMRPIVKIIKAKIDACGYRRVEMAVQVGFGAGCKLARLIGFELEAICRGYLPTGKSAYLYARVRNG